MELFARQEPLPKNPEQLIRPTKIRSKGGLFCVAGKKVEAGSEVSVPRHVAMDLVALGKAEYTQ